MLAASRASGLALKSLSGGVLVGHGPLGRCSRFKPDTEKQIKEILKLLEAGIIYPVADSQRVSPVHCVPKKGGCNIPNFQFGMLYIGNSCIVYFITFCFAILENPKQIKDPRRELGISRSSNLNFIKY